MTCKDCFYYELCQALEDNGQVSKIHPNACGFYKHKSLIVELPCKVGDIVYDIADGTAYATRVLQFVYFGDRWACRTVSSFPNVNDFGTRIFLTREAAEKALKAREGE